MANYFKSGAGLQNISELDSSNDIFGETPDNSPQVRPGFRQPLKKAEGNVHVEETPESSPLVEPGSGMIPSRRIPSDPTDSGISDSGTKSKSVTPESRQLTPHSRFVTPRSPDSRLMTPHDVASTHRSPKVVYASDSDAESQDDLVTDDEEDILTDDEDEEVVAVSDEEVVAVSDDEESMFAAARKKADVSDDSSDDDLPLVQIKSKVESKGRSFSVDEHQDSDISSHVKRKAALRIESSSSDEEFNSAPTTPQQAAPTSSNDSSIVLTPPPCHAGGSPPSGYDDSDTSHPIAKEKHSSDDDSDFRDIQFPQDTTLQQRFSNYCMQLMNDNLEDTFGFTSEQFNDTEETYGKMTASDSCLVVTDQTKKAIFEKICSARGSYESDDEEDIWADKTAQITFGNPVSSKTKASEMEEHSSDEEAAADQAVPADNMEVDQDPWGGDVDCGAVAMDTSAPWEAQAVSSPSSQGEAGGWAAFDKPDSTPAQEGEGWASFDSSGGGGASSTDDGNWADFSSLNAAGGEGFDGNSAPRPVDNKEKGEDWRPAMSSSPEATMLDQFENPLLTEDRSPFRPESPDLSNYNANQEAPTTKFQPQQAKAMEETTETGEINNANNEPTHKMTESVEQKTAQTVEKSDDGVLEKSAGDVLEKAADNVQGKSADGEDNKSADVQEKSADEAAVAGSDSDKDKSSIRLEDSDGDNTSEA